MTKSAQKTFFILVEPEKDLIQLALNNNQNQGAKLLGLIRHPLIYRMKKYDI